MKVLALVVLGMVVAATASDDALTGHCSELRPAGLRNEHVPATCSDMNGHRFRRDSKSSDYKACLCAACGMSLEATDKRRFTCVASKVQSDVTLSGAGDAEKLMNNDAKDATDYTQFVTDPKPSYERLHTLKAADYRKQHKNRVSGFELTVNSGNLIGFMKNVTTIAGLDLSDRPIFEDRLAQLFMMSADENSSDDISFVREFMWSMGQLVTLWETLGFSNSPVSIVGQVTHRLKGSEEDYIFNFGDTVLVNVETEVTRGTGKVFMALNHVTEMVKSYSHCTCIMDTAFKAGAWKVMFDFLSVNPFAVAELFSHYQDGLDFFQRLMSDSAALQTGFSYNYGDDTLSYLFQFEGTRIPLFTVKQIVPPYGTSQGIEDGTKCGRSPTGDYLMDKFGFDLLGEFMKCPMNSDIVGHGTSLQSDRVEEILDDEGVDLYGTSDEEAEAPSPSVAFMEEGERVINADDLDAFMGVNSRIHKKDSVYYFNVDPDSRSVDYTYEEPNHTYMDHARAIKNFVSLLQTGQVEDGAEKPSSAETSAQETGSPVPDEPSALGDDEEPLVFDGGDEAIVEDNGSERSGKLDADMDSDDESEFTFPESSHIPLIEEEEERVKYAPSGHDKKAIEKEAMSEESALKQDAESDDPAKKLAAELELEDEVLESIDTSESDLERFGRYLRENEDAEGMMLNPSKWPMMMKVALSIKAVTVSIGTFGMLMAVNMDDFRAFLAEAGVLGLVTTMNSVFRQIIKMVIGPQMSELMSKAGMPQSKEEPAVSGEEK